MTGRTIPRATAVSSSGNAAVRLARRLERARSERERSGCYVVWGLHLAQEAVLARAPLERVFVSEAAERSAEGRGILDAVSRMAPVVKTTGRILESIATGAGDQGILLVVRRPAIDLDAILAARPTLLLLAHGVQDPGNLGSMLRTALALGAEALLALEGCADPYGSRAARSAMGALFRLPVVVGESTRAMDALRAKGLALIAADADAGQRPDALDLRGPTALLLGSEGQGLPRAIMDRASARVRIPMTGGSASLNVHAAAAALLYEAMRQRSWIGAR